MSKLWDMKDKVMCRDCAHLTASIMIIANQTEIEAYCPTYEQRIHPDVEHFCDGFEKATFSRESAKIREREIESDVKEVEDMPYRENHEPEEIKPEDVIGWQDEDGTIHPLSELTDKVPDKKDLEKVPDDSEEV